jgi:hypothetical protein
LKTENLIGCGGRKDLPLQRHLNLRSGFRNELNLRPTWLNVLLS